MCDWTSSVFYFVQYTFAVPAELCGCKLFEGVDIKEQKNMDEIIGI